MSKKIEKVKTKRLILQPMTEEELKSKIEKLSAEEDIKAYTEMLTLAKADEANWNWYVPWKMMLKENNQVIGDVGFKGPEKENAVEIGYGIDKEYESKGYTTEAVKGMIDWAFYKDKVYIVEAETAPDNKASQRILEKLSFVPDGEGKEGPRFMFVKPPTIWTSIFLLFGLSIGMSLGHLYGSNSVGMCLGMGFGAAIGLAIDNSEKKHRKEIMDKREAKKGCI